MHAHTHAHRTHTAASHIMKPARLQINALLPAGVRLCHFKFGRETEGGNIWGGVGGNFADSYRLVRFFIL